MISRFVRVIEADGAMAENQQNAGEIGNEADVTKRAFSEVHHFRERESNAIFVRTCGSAFGAFESESGDGWWSDDAAGSAIDAGGKAGEENASEQRHGGKGSEEGREQSSGE